MKINKSKQKMGLHTFIATGGKPKDYKGCGPNAVANKKGEVKKNGK